MGETLNDVGMHKGTWGDGHYESWITANGGVTIATVFNDPKKKGENKVTLNRSEWDRLVAWVEWQRKKDLQ